MIVSRYSWHSRDFSIEGCEVETFTANRSAADDIMQLSNCSIGNNNSDYPREISKFSNLGLCVCDEWVRTICRSRSILFTDASHNTEYIQRCTENLLEN